MRFDGDTVAATAATTPENILRADGGEVSERRWCGGDDNLTGAVSPVDSDVESDDDIRPSPLRRAPSRAPAGGEK